MYIPTNKNNCSPGLVVLRPRASLGLAQGYAKLEVIYKVFKTYLINIVIVFIINIYNRLNNIGL